VIVFIAYCFAGPYLPGILWHGDTASDGGELLFSINASTTSRWESPRGSFYIFILFGAFLELSAAAGFFMDAAFAVAGKDRGGPAKVALVASGLFGMVTAPPRQRGDHRVPDHPMMKKVG
jgi:TRAP-type uncharacterized transport system fused permease subunit